MKNKELYQKTVDILVAAYFNDTLVHTNCQACAVGNIIAANNGYKYVRCIDEPRRKIAWDATGGFYGHKELASWFPFLIGSISLSTGQQAIAMKEIECTGYSLMEVKMIENSFERASRGRSEEDYMFNGLMAVIEALDVIHENTDTVTTEASKQRFTKRQLA